MHKGNLPPQGEGVAGTQLMETGCWLTGGLQAPVCLCRERSQPWHHAALAVPTNYTQIASITSYTKPTENGIAEQEFSTIYTTSLGEQHHVPEGPQHHQQTLIAAGWPGKQTLGPKGSYVLQPCENFIYPAVVTKGRNELH